jgi:hypothetical protein
MTDYYALGGRSLQTAPTWSTWGDLIHSLDRSPLPYLDTTTGPILDTTYGLGVFWNRYQPLPATVTTNDADPAKNAHHRWNWLDTDPPADWLAHYQTVIFDPPFKLSGTNRIMLDGNRYGLADNALNGQRLDALQAGALNVARCAAPGGYILVKCQPQVAGGRVRWQPRQVANTLEHAGYRITDELIYHYRPIPQPGNRTQQHARRNYSVLIIAQTRA